MDDLVATAPLHVGAVLLGAWALWRRNDSDVRSEWRAIAGVVIRLVVLFLAVGAVLLNPRLLPVVIIGVLALFAVWWWLQHRHA